MSPNNRRSERSLSASPSRPTLPTLAFASAMKAPYKASVSPPSTTFSSHFCASPRSQTSTGSSDMSLSPVSSASSTSSDLSLSPIISPSSLSTSSYLNCATPDWPQRTLLTPLSSFCGSAANSYISDEDLMDLSLDDLCNDTSVQTCIEPEISWEQTKQPPLVLQSMPTVARRAPPPAPKRRRKTSPLARRKVTLAMSPIAEGPE
ncbi:hypothetical protein N7G274_002888 [Stereocaulon virgatum]|uniref:Uncharacterized protein n=1 Tax=Stereocaulon virgatum TaxID=373712 RepID=A0ABR4AL72_9LECA